MTLTDIIPQCQSMLMTMTDNKSKFDRFLMAMTKIIPQYRTMSKLKEDKFTFLFLAKRVIVCKK